MMRSWKRLFLLNVFIYIRCQVSGLTYDEEYIGCAKEEDFPSYHLAALTSEAVTVAGCRQSCAHDSYFSFIVTTKHCMCIESPWPFTSEENNRCVKCVGSTDEICGTNGFGAVYDFSELMDSGMKVAFQNSSVQVNELSTPESYITVILTKTVSITTAAPTTTGSVIVLPVVEEVDTTYAATTDVHFGTLSDNMTNTSPDTSNPLTITAGPFGFGSAVAVHSQYFQCLLSKPAFLPGNGSYCISRMSDCNSGLSIGIWEKPYFAYEVADYMTNASLPQTPRYIISTGGDTVGHPGIALYHEGPWLKAVVATSTQCWAASVLGPLKNNTWANIGLLWEASSTGRGLQILVNLKQVAQTRLPIPVTTPKGELSPPQMMLGCTKNADTATYSGYNDAELDELAMWHRKLASNETIFLLGGYVENYTQVSPEAFAAILGQVDLTDPSQSAAAAQILSEMTSSAPTTASPTQQATTGSTGASPTVSSTASTATTINPAEARSFDTLTTMMSIMTDRDNAPSKLKVTEFKAMLGLIGVESNLLDLTNANKWANLQNDPDRGGSSKVVQDTQQWAELLLARVTPFDNNSQPIIYGHQTKNIGLQANKYLVRDLRDQGRKFSVPDYRRVLPTVKENFGQPYDAVTIPTYAFNDERCFERPISITFFIYKTYDKVAPLRVNPANINSKAVNTLDSRVISVSATVDPAVDSAGNLDPSQPQCIPDPEHLRRDPVRFKLEHKQKIAIIRKLLLFEDVSQSNIKARRCVWWNANVSDFGGWDARGCNVLDTSEEYTKCICNKFGTYAILAEKVDPKTVPDEPYWLTVTKYIVYGISGFLLLLYIFIVVFSGDLKEQFHIIGLNLSAAVLMGSVAICLSDLQALRGDRELCFTIGTIIHYFYAAVGFWIVVLGHACFKAITAGIITGLLNAYIFIGWGLPLAMTGIPMIGFLYFLGTDPRCFISWENEVKLIFFAPQLLCAVAGLFFASVVLCNLNNSALRKDNLIQDYGSFCKGASALMIAFAIIWCFGLLAYIRFDEDTSYFYPAFHVLNSCMGIFIFAFIGIGSNRFRLVLAGHAKKRREMLKAFAVKPEDTKLK